ncbi:hypothetical protein Noda2021_10950 [Candidatus Dependentiae bacterium Noda2021]|nr:hypothetical protein Noda2021_10950 [Candidatus Dependentiae bacterium Noda2021]
MKRALIKKLLVIVVMPLGLSATMHQQIFFPWEPRMPEITAAINDRIARSRNVFQGVQELELLQRDRIYSYTHVIGLYLDALLEKFPNQEDLIATLINTPFAARWARVVKLRRDDSLGSYVRDILRQ